MAAAQPIMDDVLMAKMSAAAQKLTFDTEPPAKSPVPPKREPGLSILMKPEEKESEILANLKESGECRAASLEYFQYLELRGTNKQMAKTLVREWLDKMKQAVPGTTYTLKDIMQVVEAVYVNAKQKGDEPPKEKAFEQRDDGLHYVPVINGTTVDVDGIHVCGPIRVIAYARTSDDEAWSLQLSFKNRDGQGKEYLLRIGDLEAPGSTWLADLMNAGLLVGDDPEANGLLKRWLKGRKPEKRIRLVERVGWTPEFSAFMLPTGPVPAPPEQGDLEHFVFKVRKTKALFGVKGTLNEWQENIGKYCVGNSRLLFTVSGAFLAPLARLMGIKEGKGFHIFQNASSIGKTTATQVGGTVYGGGGKNGFLQSWNSTPNAMEGICEQHRDCALFLDELGTADARKLGSLIYTTVAGEGKARLNRNSELRESREWFNVIFSTGEISTEAHMKTEDPETRLRGGQEIRVLNIPADAGAGLGVFENLHGVTDPEGTNNAGHFSKMLKANTHLYYGAPLIAWLEALVLKRAPLLKRAHDIVAEFRTKYAQGVGPQVGRVADTFALVAAAGELATEEGITGWPKGAATEAAATIFDAWRKDRETEGSSDDHRMVEQVRKFYQTQKARFERIVEDDKNPDKEFVAPARSMTLAGYVRQGDNGELEFCTYDKVFEDDVCAGFDCRQVAKALAAEHLITATEKGKVRYKVYRRVPGIGKMRFYVLRGSILGIEGTEAQKAFLFPEPPEFPETPAPRDEDAPPLRRVVREGA